MMENLHQQLVHLCSFRTTEFNVSEQYFTRQRSDSEAKMILFLSGLRHRKRKTWLIVGLFFFFTWRHQGPVLRPQTTFRAWKWPKSVWSEIWSGSRTKKTPVTACADVSVRPRCVHVSAVHTYTFVFSVLSVSSHHSVCTVICCFVKL